MVAHRSKPFLVCIQDGFEHVPAGVHDCTHSVTPDTGLQLTWHDLMCSASCSAFRQQHVTSYMHPLRNFHRHVCDMSKQHRFAK